MRISDPGLEKLAIRTITAGTKISSAVLSRLRRDHFVYEPAAEAYTRISTVLRERGRALAWGELLHDPIISDDTKNMLRAYQKAPLATLSHVDILTNNLNNYRKLRKLHEAVNVANNAFKADKIDPDRVLTAVGNLLTEAKHSVTLDDAFTHIGVDGNSDPIIRAILKGTGQLFIPTGFKAFDTNNVGLPHGGLTMLAATTGGGKSAMALQLAVNMAKGGAKVCTVPLEMNRHEVMMRRMANITRTNMTDLVKLAVNPDGMPLRTKQRIWHEMAQYDKLLKSKGSVETYFNPPTDMTMEEILFALQPYGYNVIIIDYVGLLKGVDGDDQWQKLGAAARFAKVFAENTGTNIVICAQLSAEGFVRYSRAMVEHANNAWTWVYDEGAAQSHILPIDQAKARNQQKYRFNLVEDFATMTIRDLTPDELASLGAEDYDQGTTQAGGPPSVRRVTPSSGGGGGKPGGNRLMGGGATPGLDEYYSQ